MTGVKRDHGGGLDAAIACFGGERSAWIDLSTGINPVPYPIPELPSESWTALPDHAATAALEQAARRFWSVPSTAAVLAMSGASSPISLIPQLAPAGTADVQSPTYNEHAAAFAASGWSIGATTPTARVAVHPNNPDGRMWRTAELPAGPLTIIDESFCDVASEHSLIHLAARPNTLVLKSFGKFWGLAGLRLGFAIGDPALIGRLQDLVGPWPVSGPALVIGAAALTDPEWAETTRHRLSDDAARLDRLMQARGAAPLGGTTLFRLYDTEDAQHWQARLAAHRIWTRVFPYSNRWLRLGLPAPQQWDHLEAAL